MFERIFSQDDLMAFAQLSGDFNPIHVDPVQARRFMFNSTVAHGISVLLWALACGLRSRSNTIHIQSIRAQFKRSVRVGEQVSCLVKEANDDASLIEVIRRTETAAKIEVAWTLARRERKDSYSPKDPQRLECRIRTIRDIAAAQGEVPLHLDLELLSSLFPSLSQRLDPVQISQLLATTRVVGMECPGLHSIYSGLDLDFANQGAPHNVLEYKVGGVDERMGKVAIAVRSDNLRGTLVTYFRPPPVEQAELESLTEHLVKGEFESQKALVVGGSRGIGEVIAKLLAGGGAEVHLTFNQGKEDADRIVREIVSHGGKATSSFLNVLDPAHASLENLVNNRAPTHLYYLATPPIFVGAHKSFSPSVFSRFCDFYVGGLVNVIAKMVTPKIRGIFFPSSVAVEELPANMREYVAAKMAGKGLCSLLEKWYPEVVVSRPRLPRMSTDQTMSLLRESSPAPQKIMLDHLRWLHGATKSSKK